MRGGQISNPSLSTGYPIPFSSLPSYLPFAWPQTHVFCMEGTRETPCLSQWKKILRELLRGGSRQEPRRVELPGALPLVKSPVRVCSESGQSQAKHPSSCFLSPALSSPRALFPSSFAPVSESAVIQKVCLKSTSSQLGDSLQGHFSSSLGLKFSPETEANKKKSIKIFFFSPDFFMLKINI